MIIKTLIYFCLLSILFGGVMSDRKITVSLNPGCNVSNCKNMVLAHVKAEGENDTLHHLWDFTGKPALLLAVTQPNATITIAWQDFSFGLDGAINIDPPPTYIYGVVIDQMIEFNDEEDTGALNQSSSNSSYVSLMDTKNFDWKISNLTNSSSKASLTIEATEYSDEQLGIKKTGIIRIEMSAYGGEDHGDVLPHLLHSGNASQMDLTVEKLTTQYTNSRFGLHLVTVSSDNVNGTVTVRPRKTLDDEHAPGVFTMVEMLTPPAMAGQCGGYLQWRPVVYTSSAREMTSSTETVEYAVAAPAEPSRTLNLTLLYSVFGNRLDEMLVVATNITFGTAGDGFFHKYQYAAWTMLVGYGHPPEEQFSMLVTLVLLLGLGLPAIVILTGTVCIVVRRLQRNKDDLFLSR
uniref:Lysosomal protein NCU-G1 n=1 Tax=Homalodisca liturata TaxID=320908 RepID=A0A1B6JGH5_9HEMI